MYPMKSKFQFVLTVIHFKNKCICFSLKVKCVIYFIFLLEPAFLFYLQENIILV